MLTPEPKPERKTSAITVDLGTRCGDLDRMSRHYNIPRAEILRRLIDAAVLSDPELFAKCRNAAVAETAEARAKALAGPVIG